MESGGFIAEMLNDITTRRRNIMQRIEETEKNKLKVPVDYASDAMDLLSALETKTSKLAERNALIYLNWMREEKRAGRLRNAYWVDTVDCVPDCLTKQSQADLIIAIMAGEWLLQKQHKLGAALLSGEPTQPV